MDSLGGTSEPMDLARDLDWLAQLARRIVHDPGLADDAVQEAWISASRRAVAGQAPERTALARALRGILKQSWRTEHRRTRRERAAARPEALLSPEEILVIGERQRLLWRHLAALREPFRSTLLRRFQQGAEINALAAQERVGADAIRWRIRRGLAMLRDSLEREDGGAGVLGLAPLVAVAGPVTNAAPAAVAGGIATEAAGGAGTILGVAWMQKTMVSLGVLIAAVLVGTVAWQALDLHRPEGELGESLRTAEPALAPGKERVALAGQGELAQLAQADRGRATVGALLDVPETAIETTTITGRMTDSSGEPIAGVAIRLEGGGVTPWVRELQSGDDGRFEALCPRESLRQTNLFATKRPHTNRLIRCFGTGTHCHFPPLTVPAIDVGDLALSVAGVLTGQVVNQDGEPLAGASVYVTNIWGSGQTTGIDGRFELIGIDAGTRYVSANVGGHASDGALIDVKPGAETEVRALVLRRGGVLRGRVMDPDGNPIGGAIVDDAAVCDARGEFELETKSSIVRYVRAEADGYRTSLASTFHVGAEAEITLHPLGDVARFRFVNSATGDPVLSVKLRVTEREVDPSEQLGPSDLAGWRHPAAQDPTDELPAHWSALALPAIDAVHVEAFGYVTQECLLSDDAFDGGIQDLALTPICVGPLTGVALLRGAPMEHASVEILVFETLDLSRDEVVATGADASATVLRIRQRHRVYTDATGRFAFRGELTGPVQALIRLDGERAFLSARVTPPAVGPIDLGELPLVTLPSLRGRIQFQGTLPDQVASTDYGLVSLLSQTESEGRDRLALTGDGAFVFEGLVPGLHAVNLRAEILGAGPRGLVYLVDVPAGGVRDCVLNVKLEPLATIELDLTVNGIHWERDFYASLEERGKGFRGWSDFSDPVDGRATITVPAHRDYRLVLDLGMTDYNGSFEPAVDVACPPGVSRLDVNLGTAALELTLPADWDPAERGWVFLEWNDASGVRRMRIPSEESLTAPIVRADRTVGHLVRFVSVPAELTEARVVFEPSSAEEGDVSKLGTIQPTLRPGAVARLTMR